MLLNSRNFTFSVELTDFVNSYNIPQADILKLDADAANGGWSIWWYGVLINPPSPSTPPKGSLSFKQAYGAAGTPTWALTANPSGGSINASTGVYTAGATGSVTDVVRVTDAAGNVKSMNIAVGPGVSILPNPATVANGGALDFSATGGSGKGYVWTIPTNNSGATISAQGHYVAGATPGTDVVRCTDSLGNVANRNVVVT